MDKQTEQLQYQRIRNRIIELLEIMTSFSEQEKLGADEVVNMWQDWVDDERLHNYIEPVFSTEEQCSLAKFNTTWQEVTDRFPQFMPGIADLRTNKDWLHMMHEANTTLQSFNLRGKLSEEIEIT